MKIDWKAVSKSSGYRSLKKAYEHDVVHKWRSKEDLRRQFRWVIQRAMHYAYHLNKDIAEVINEWEEDRDYWWLNYYQDSNIPKIHNNSIKPMGFNGAKKYYKKCYGKILPEGIKNRLQTVYRKNL